MIRSNESAVKKLKKEAIETKDCIYEAMAYTAQASIDYLKDIQSKKVVVNKGNIDKLMQGLKEMKNDPRLETAAEYIILGRINVLERLKEECFTEIHHRVSKKMRLEELTFNIEYLMTKISNIREKLEENEGIFISDKRIFMSDEEILKMDSSEHPSFPSRIYCKIGEGGCSTWESRCKEKNCNKIKVIEMYGYYDMIKELQKMKKEQKELENYSKESKEQKCSL